MFPSMTGYAISCSTTTTNWKAKIVSLQGTKQVNLELASYQTKRERNNPVQKHISEVRSGDWCVTLAMCWRIVGK